MALTKFINTPSEFVEHSSIGSVQTHKQQYVLNIKKSIEKKMNCAKKKQIIYQITGGVSQQNMIRSLLNFFSMHSIYNISHQMNSFLVLTRII
jgi:hypothetical protein